ncbi:MAG: hypothetical protein AB8G86_29250 [Saprospiraceae bacterium]
MRKALWIPACLLLFFIGDRLGGFILSKITAKSQFRYTRLYEGQAEADLLFLGNSRGLIFYQPYIEEITGKSTLNLSYNSMPIDLGRVVVTDYLEKYEAPELLVIDVTMCDRHNPQLIAGFNTFSKYSDNLNRLIKTKDKKSWYAGKLSNLYRYNSEVFQRTLYYLGKSDEDWLNDRVISPTMEANIVNEEAVDLTIDDYLLTELDELIKTAEAKGVEVVLVVNPYYPPYIQKMKTFYNFLGLISGRTNKEIKDYSRVLTTTNGFADYQHLNKEGSKKYMDLLLRDGVLSKK